MMTASWCASLLIAQAMLGIGHGRGHGGCGDCGADPAKVSYEVMRLQTCDRWRARDNAAHALAKFDWKCHPEIVPVLVNALLRDCEEEVREEAAESLTKLAPCLPEVHAALERAARCDPDHATRKQAARGLKALANGCEAPCNVCGPQPAGLIVPVPAHLGTHPEWRGSFDEPVYEPYVPGYGGPIGPSPLSPSPYRRAIPLDPYDPPLQSTPMPYNEYDEPASPLDRLPALPSPSVPPADLEPLPPLGGPEPFDRSARRDPRPVRPSPPAPRSPIRNAGLLFPRTARFDRDR